MFVMWLLIFVLIEIVDIVLSVLVVRILCISELWVSVVVWNRVVIGIGCGWVSMMVVM